MKILACFRALLVIPLALALTLLVSIETLLRLLLFRQTYKEVAPSIRFWGRAICWASGVSVRTEETERLPRERSYIFAANHQSQFDIFALQGYLTADFRWLAKKELFRVPVWGTAMRLAGYIAIDRSHGREAMKSLDEAAQRIAEGTSVVIFPEGTRSRDGKLQPFKAGGMMLAIKSGVPLVPVAILGTHEILPKGRLLARPGRVLIRIGRPIDTVEYRQRDKHLLAGKLQAAVAELLARPS